jgi:hypothetical protein
MAKSRTRTKTVPESMSILEASDFWDKHSFLDFPDVREVKDVDIEIEHEVFYCPVSRGLMK